MAESHPSISGGSDSGGPVPSFENWSWEQFEYLARSPKRIRVLHVLDEDARRKRELSGTLNIPRSTLLRTLREMSEYGWVTEQQNGVFETTSAGDRIVDMFGGFYEQFHSLAGLTQLEQALPSELTDCPEFHSLLQEGVGYDEISTYVSTSDSPYEPMRRFAEELRSANVEYLFLGVANPLYNDVLQELLEEGSVSKLIIPRNIVNVVCQREQLQDIDGPASVSISVTEGQFEYGGYRTSEKFVVEGLNEDQRTQVVVVLSLTSGAVEKWFDRIISVLETKASENHLPSE